MISHSKKPRSSSATLYHVYVIDLVHYKVLGWFQWPRGLRPRSVAARLLRMWVRYPLGSWMSVCLSVVSAVCNELITRPEEALAHWGLSHPQQKNVLQFISIQLSEDVFMKSQHANFNVSNYWCVRQQSHSKVFQTTDTLYVLSGFCHHMNKTSVLLNHYTAYNNNFMLTLWDMMLVPTTFTK
jgi:hypothetical protein